MRLLLLLLALPALLAACAPPPPETPARIAPAPGLDLPPMKTFAAPRPRAPDRSNQDIARDFLDLSFRLESGRALPVLTRFEGPVTVRLLGPAPPELEADLDGLIARLRREAGLRISRSAAASASITIEVLPRSDISRTVPQAACFVAPNVGSFAEYRRAPRGAALDWVRLTERRRIAVFVPVDVSPQEARDCLHEELAQALGPLNDLYRLRDSVFNDDNMHTVLTGFDMLLLRITYDPALRSGMPPDAVARALPGILARLNPGGQRPGRAPPAPTPPDWVAAIQEATGPGASMQRRIDAASRAARRAEEAGLDDGQRAFARYALGRLSLARDPRLSLRSFLDADRLYARLPGTEVHRAHVAAQIAAFSLAAGDAASTLEIVTPHIEAARAHENAALLATLLMLRAEALGLDGRTEAARRVRLDSLGWARYGFGPDGAVRARLREIAALRPL